MGTDKTATKTATTIAHSSLRLMIRTISQITKAVNAAPAPPNSNSSLMPEILHVPKRRWKGDLGTVTSDHSDMTGWPATHRDGQFECEKGFSGFTENSFDTTGLAG